MAMMLGQFPLPNSVAFDVSEPPIKLQNLCRMCAGTCNTPVPLYGPEGIAHELSIKFCSYLPVKVSETDTLPLQLCYDCTNLLIQWDAAVLVAIAADKKLRALQWREEFERQRAEESMKSRGSVTEESLSCSLCPKNGMVFRELIEHLKSHEMPPSLSKENNTADCSTGQRESHPSETTGPNEVGDSDTTRSVTANLLEPIVCLETSGSKRILRPKRKSIESNSKNVKVRLRSKRKSLGNQDDSLSENSEDGSEDGIVTSSTSSGQSLLRKPETESNSDKKLNNVQKESDLTSFKPKVRIISAESINQSLEERAKANLTAKSPESRTPISVKSIQQPLQSVLKPLSVASALQKTIVLPGGVFKVDGIKAPTKILKLPDGRYVRLLETKLPVKGGKLVYPASVHRTVPSTVLNRLGQSPTVSNQALDKEKSPLNQPSPQVNHPVSPVVIAPAPPVPDKNSSPDESALKVLPKSVMLSDSKIITFNHQPGPKNTGSRYICVFCGKRNLTQECLEPHAKSHSKDQVPNVAVPSDSSD